MPIEGDVNETETKPHQSNALHPNELGLGRIRVTQARVRVKVESSNLEIGVGESS